MGSLVQFYYPLSFYFVISQGSTSTLTLLSGVKLEVFFFIPFFFHHKYWMVPLTPTASDEAICGIALVDVKYPVNFILRTVKGYWDIIQK